MIISNNNSSSYTQKSVDQSNAKVPTQVANTKSTDVYESSTKSNSNQPQYDSYSAKPNTPQIDSYKRDLDETGVPKTYHPSWPKEIRKSFWDHDKNLTLMEQARAPSFRIAVEMSVFKRSPNDYPSELTEKGKFLAMLEDIKVKWKGHLSSGTLSKDDQEMYEKLVKDVDIITKRI
jgi:hypothetical protein